MTPSVLDAPLRDRVLWCVKKGAWFSAFWAAWVLGVHVLDPSREFQHFTVGGMFVFYIIIGPACGAAVGALLPLARTLVGAIIIGAVAAIPAAVLLPLLEVRPRSATAQVVLGALVVLVGALAGLLASARQH